MRINWWVCGLVGLIAIANPVQGQEAGVIPGIDVQGGVDPQPILPEDRLTNLLTNPASNRGFFVTGEYLLIRPARQGLDLGVLAPNLSNPRVGRMESLTWDFTSGFRVGGGYRLPTDGWEIGAYFTYFHARDNRTVTAPPGGALIPALSPTTGGPVGSADGDNDLGYSLLDLEVAKTLSVGDVLGLRLFGGVRLARIDQSLKTIYTGGVLGSTADYVQSPVRFLGAGFTGGTEGTWQVYRGWGLYGRARVSLLAGRFTDPLTETIGSASPVVAIADRFGTVVPLGELGAGVVYCGHRIFFAAGYDLVDWFNLPNGLTVPIGAFPGTITRRRSDLTIEAVSIKLGFNF